MSDPNPKLLRLFPTLPARDTSRRLSPTSPSRSLGSLAMGSKKGKKAPAKQTTMTDTALPLIKKPNEIFGKQIADSVQQLMKRELL